MTTSKGFEIRTATSNKAKTWSRNRQWDRQCRSFNLQNRAAVRKHCNWGKGFCWFNYNLYKWVQQTLLQLKLDRSRAFGRSGQHGKKGESTAKMCIFKYSAALPLFHEWIPSGIALVPDKPPSDSTATRPRGDLAHWLPCMDMHGSTLVYYISGGGSSKGGGCGIPKLRWIFSFKRCFKRCANLLKNLESCMVSRWRGCGRCFCFAFALLLLWCDAYWSSLKLSEALWSSLKLSEDCFC